MAFECVCSYWETGRAQTHLEIFLGLFICSEVGGRTRGWSASGRFEVIVGEFVAPPGGVGEHPGFSASMPG